MKISLEWLGEHLQWKESDPAAIARVITAHIAEVDDIHQQGALLRDCCVGKVLSVHKHPNADKLSLCDVQTDRGTKRVVCGGTNLRSGMRVAFAHVGATVRWHGDEMVTLEPAKIRGETSEGMICAAEELDIADRFPATPDQGERPIVDLGDGESDVGTSLQEYLGLNDTVLDIDNHAITHRPDLFSQIGFARELVAVGLATWKKEPDIAAPAFGKGAVPFSLSIESPTLMPRYCACMIEIDGLGETPEWMRRRLEATGWRSINLPIDITNYVATEIGVPLHSFDADDIRGDVHMRTAKKGEKITTLDNKTFALPNGALVLSDDEGIFDLLGIMGGLRSSTKSSTRRIYLHSASLDPMSIRRTVIATGHRTDAATVYEKGVPHSTAEQGFYRAVELFLELVPGARIASKKESVGTNGTAQVISLSLARVQSVLGAEIPTADVARILEALGCEVQKGKSAAADWSVTPPLWRMGDMKAQHDLIEEIGRIYGYDRIASQMPLAATVPPARDHRQNRMRDALKEEGCIEIVPLSLVGPELLRRCAMDPEAALGVDNALGEELSLLQPSVLPALLSHAEENLRHTDRACKTFAIAHAFSAQGEHTELAMLVASRRKTGTKDDPFLEVKDGLIAALSTAGHTLEVAPAKEVPAFAHPGRCAALLQNGVSVGTVFEVHPTVREAFDLPHRAAAVVLNLDAVFKADPIVRLSPRLSAFPAIVYDVTVQLTPKQSAAVLRSKMQQQTSLLQQVEFADLYGAPGAKDYAVTFRLTYQSNERTLTEAEVKAEHEKVLAVLQ
jgi:phenylalanyl-tRNA synthetase beta chain